MQTRLLATKFCIPPPRPRELEVLMLIAEGLSNQEVAESRPGHAGMPIGSESDAKQQQAAVGICFQGQLGQQYVRVSPAGQVSGERRRD